MIYDYTFQTIFPSSVWLVAFSFCVTGNTKSFHELYPQFFLAFFWIFKVHCCKWVDTCQFFYSFGQTSIKLTMMCFHVCKLIFKSLSIRPNTLIEWLLDWPGICGGCTILYKFANWRFSGSSKGEFAGVTWVQIWISIFFWRTHGRGVEQTWSSRLVSLTCTVCWFCLRIVENFLFCEEVSLLKIMLHKSLFICHSTCCACNPWVARALRFMLQIVIPELVRHL